MAEQAPSEMEKALEFLASRSSLLVPAAVLVGATALGLIRGPGAAVLALAAGLLLGAIASLWSSLRVLAGDAPLTLHEAIDLGAPTEQQARKEALLLAIKELQSEHALGKLSDDDFKDMSARYRAQAKQLLREMDEDLAPARQKAEALLAARLEGKPAEGDEEAEEEAPKKKKKGKKAARKAEEAKAAEKEDARDDEAAPGEKASEEDEDAKAG